MSEEHMTALKKISLTLRDINQGWIKDGDATRVIARIIELDRKIYSKIKRIEIMKGCGKRYPLEGSEELFPTMGTVCGDNRFHEEGDKPNLCPECKIKFGFDKDMVNTTSEGVKA